ncbi:hypothetical protein MRX96_019534 [Rhipicephalus microplus]
MPALTERVRYLLRNLNPQESADYESVKAAVLTELKLSPAEYLQRFERAVKRKEETWAQFASRVKIYFSYYLQVREADTVEVMAELMVADRIKSGLSTEGLEYVRLREGEGWLRPTEIAKVLQTFEQAKGKGRASKQPTVEMGQKPATRVEKGALKCHLCHGSGHFAKECPKASDKENNPKKATEPKRKVQKVTLSHETDTEMPTGVLSAKVKSLKHEGEGTDKLQLIPVSCAGISADAILDTGSEITVIRESLLPRSVVEPSGTVRLVSAFGKTIEARLATLPVKLNSTREVTVPQNVDLLCALTDELVEGTDCLLTKDDWKLLLKASSPLASCRAPAEPAHEAEQAVEKQKVVACNLTLEEKDDPGEEAQTDEEREASLGQRVEFRNLQLGDTTLKKCWEDARKVWGAETPQRTKHEDHLSPPVFRQVRGSRPVERRLYYHSLFQNGPPEHYAPPKQPKAPHRIPCFNQPTNAVHAKAETREPRGAQAALRETILSSANWPTCAEACQDQTSQVPSRKSWAQKVATTNEHPGH